MGVFPVCSRSVVDLYPVKNFEFLPSRQADLNVLTACHLVKDGHLLSLVLGCRFYHSFLLSQHNYKYVMDSIIRCLTDAPEPVSTGLCSAYVGSVWTVEGRVEIYGDELSSAVERDKAKRQASMQILSGQSTSSF